MIAYVLIGLFVVTMLTIGLWGMKKTVSLNDFFLGGRTIGPWISAVAYGTAYFSAVLFIGFAGSLGWRYGFSALWVALGNAVLGALGAWLVLARRTRTMTKNLDVMTMPEFLDERYEGKYIKIISAIVIFVFLLPYSASVFKGLGHLFESGLGISYNAALLFMVAVTGIYLILGGYFAITLNDFIQGFIMIIGSILMVAILIAKAETGGDLFASHASRYAQNISEMGSPSMLVLVCLVFMTSFGTWGMPQMVQKFYAIKSESVIKKAAIVTAVFATIIGFSAYFTGSMSHFFFDSVPLSSTGGPNFDRLVPDMLVANLPEFLMAVIILLVLSASMSTLSSLVLVSASSVAIDLYKGHANISQKAETPLFMMRFLSGIFIGISYLIARYEFAFILTLMSLSWGAVAGSFMAVYIYGLYWKGTTRVGAEAGMVTGLTLAIVLFFVLGPAMSPVASTIAMISPFIVIPIVSKFTKPVSKEVIDKAFETIK